MRYYGVINGMIRVNKSRARAMYNSGYEIKLMMNTDKVRILKRETLTYITNLCDGDFDHVVLDFYLNHRGNDVGYTVEYWVPEIDNKEYLKEYSKEQQRKYKAKKCR